MRARLSLLAAVCLVASLVTLTTGAGLQAQETPDDPRTERTRGDVVGASIAHPPDWQVEREPYTFDGTYGFTMWEPGVGPEREHWGFPAVRVALAPDLGPGQIEAQVRKVIEAYPDLSIERKTISVGEQHEGVAVGPIPGSSPSYQVYVPVNGRVYVIDVYREELGEEAKGLLLALRFEPPSRSVESLGLPSANSPEALYATSVPEVGQEELADRAEGSWRSESSGTKASSRRAGDREKRIAQGCWRANKRFYVQTQHGRYANRGGGDRIPTGRALMGAPNFWDEQTHGRRGYGRCRHNSFTNDKFAVDYRLDRNDYVFSPFGSGKVIFAGRNRTHKDYGILVAIRAGNGKYVSLSGHLDSIRRGLDRGDRVNRKTVIGYAGNSGGPNFSVGPVHLHQAFYRRPSLNPDGSPYGGEGLQVVRHHYVRGDGGVYRFGWNSRRGVKTKGSLIRN